MIRADLPADVAGKNPTAARSMRDRTPPAGFLINGYSVKSMLWT
jgi:hypothetical protein